MPDHLNAAKHPIFVDVYCLASGYEPYGYFMDLNILIDCFFVGMPEIRWSDSKTPLSAWYQTHGIDTPQDILEQTQQVVPIIDGLEEAFSHPHCQWFRNTEMTENGHPSQVIDSTNSMTRLRWLIQGRVVAHLKLGNSELARQELGVLIDLSQSTSEGSDLLAMLITNSATQIVLESTKSILHHPNWAPEDLLSIRHQLMAIDLLEDYATSRRIAMASAVHGLTKVLDQDWSTLFFYDSDRPWLNAVARSVPDGWHYQNFARAYWYWNEHIVGTYDSESKRILTTNRTPRVDQCYRCPSPYTITANTLGEINFTNFLKTAATNQTRVDLLAVLCQLERHRLTYGRFPQSMEGLTSLPHDYVTGEPSFYEHRPDGTILLASLDWAKTCNPDDYVVRLELR